MRKSWLLWLLTIGFVWILITRFEELEELGRTVATGRWQWLLTAFVLQVLYYIAYTGVYKFAFITVNVQSNLWELLPVTWAALFANLAAPTGGAVGAALFVDEVARRGESRARATVGVMLMLVVDFGMLSLFALASLGILFAKRQVAFYEVAASLILFGVVMAMAAALVGGRWRPHWLRIGLDWIQRTVNGVGGWFRRPALLDETWSARNTDEFQAAAQAMFDHPRALLWTTLTAFVAHAIDLLSLYTLFLAFDQPVTPSILFVGYSMTVLFGVIAPTPNGVGVVEGIMPIIYASLGLPLAKATVISLAFRGMTFWLPMMAGFFFLRRLKLFTPSERLRPEGGQPHFVAIATAIMGLLNVLSGVMPGLAEQIQVIANFSPLAVRYGDHMTSVLAGFALLLLAYGLWRRTETAWWLTLGILILSALIHLFKGLNYEVASLAIILAVLLWTQRAHFQVRAEPPARGQGLGVLVAAFCCTELYGTLGIYLLDGHFQAPYSFAAALRQTIVMFTQFYDPGLHPITDVGRYFVTSIYMMGAVTLGYALLILLQPIFVRQVAKASEGQRAPRIVEKTDR